MINVFDITEFGAVGDRKTDCTAAIQAALDKAGEVCGVVTVPPGEYLCGMLHMRAKTRLSGFAAWSFRNDGLSTFILNDPNAVCLLDITGAFGCNISAMCFDGARLGKGIHGISLDWPEYNGGGQEDTPTIEDCRVGNFTGNGVNLRHIWCFSIRHSMLHRNVGHGLYIDGWDGFIIDNWFSGNVGAGIYGDKCVASVTTTGNRVEWNSLAGFYMHNTSSTNITGNYFDRSGGPAIDLFNEGEGNCSDITITGNIMYRSGKPRREPFADKYESSHIRMNRCINVIITGNTLHVGKDDGGHGTASPEYGIVYKKLKSCIISNNLLECGSITQNLVDLGENNANIKVTDNIGAETPGRDDIYCRQ